MSAPPPPVHQPTSPGPKPLPPNPFDLVSVPERYQIKNQSSFEWVITNWSQFKTAEKRYSDEFVMGDSRWRLMVFPNGNRTPDWLSVFLECLDFVEPTTPVNGLGQVNHRDCRW